MGIEKFRTHIAALGGIDPPASIVRAMRADFVVDPDGGGTHTALQDALDDAATLQAGNRKITTIYLVPRNTSWGSIVMPARTGIIITGPPGLVDGSHDGHYFGGSFSRIADIQLGAVGDPTDFGWLALQDVWVNEDILLGDGQWRLFAEHSGVGGELLHANGSDPASNVQELILRGSYLFGLVDLNLATSDAQIIDCYGGTAGFRFTGGYPYRATIRGGRYGGGHPVFNENNVTAFVELLGGLRVDIRDITVPLGQNAPGALVYFDSAGDEPDAMVTGSRIRLQGFHNPVYLVQNEGVAKARCTVADNRFSDEAGGDGYARGAIGAFDDSQLGPNIPNSLDYSGVTGNNNKVWQ